MKDKIIGALIGLARACGNNPKTENTDEIIRSSLELCVEEREIFPAELKELIEKIHTEKYTVVPDCAVCKNPCGNTADFDMSLLKNDKNLNIKREILLKLCELAKQGVKSDIFLRTLPTISYELEAAAYEKILKETEDEFL